MKRDTNINTNITNTDIDTYCEYEVIYEPLATLSDHLEKNSII